MNRMKKIIEWFKKPHGLPLVLVYLITIASIVGAILLTTLGSPDSGSTVFAYILFGVAAITLGYTVYTVVYFIPKLKQKIILWAQKYDFTNRILASYGFRTIIFSIFSLAVTVAYALFNGVISIISLSVWYGALACYYLFLVLLRGGILFYHRKKRKRIDAGDSESDRKIQEIKTCRTCGWILIILPACLSIAIAQMISSEKSFEHAGLMIYAAAAYTFYKIIMSVINFVRAKKNEDMTVQAMRNINLADALVSVLALQTAMFRAFSPGASVGLANALTGGAVCFLTIALGLYMLISANLKLKKIREVKCHE